MKMRKAIIRPERIDFVKKALENYEFYGMTVTEVMGREDQKGITLQFRGGTMAIDLLPKISIEVVIKHEHAETVIRLIQPAVKTEKMGDGKIFQVPVKKMVRVRTNEVEA